jgi:hypothetical protein
MIWFSDPMPSSSAKADDPALHSQDQSIMGKSWMPAFAGMTSGMWYEITGSGV